MTSKDLFTQLIDFILTSKLEGMELVTALQDKYCLSEKPDNSLRCVDKYKVAFENDYITDQKVISENGFGLIHLAQAKTEFWNGKELDEEITFNSYQKVQLHFLRWCRLNKDRIKKAKNGHEVKVIQPTIRQIEAEEKPKPKHNETEAEYLWAQAMQKQFELFKENGILSIIAPSQQYRIFVERGLITKGDSDNYFDKAKEIILAQKKQWRTFPKDRFHRDALTDSIHRIQDGKPSDNDISEIRQQQSLLSIENYYLSVTTLNI